MSGDAYKLHELLTLGRIRRAVRRRVMAKAESMAMPGVPLDRAKLEELTEQEWQELKAAVKSSPMAKEAAREQIRHTVSSILDDVAKADKEQGQGL
ncbi:MAG: hypothetical protein AB1603_07130 [Chloroflexota bacterium]